ncbi:CheR family methyltransferase [Paraburkholderia terricola]|uniref:histidine kinase n=1 Tax=Paraburkholderia terricola TaxID=169427 RepID=A0ABU1LR93_9BURK|nr:CheR family methyltransferase [Paraburkholderia terricola]MDR6409219.1 two-component system CheB/CheR fusion protein [Paraburkholderia terricola]MDR6482518.1 two-component system CheB/CheR fusion protein [Paraburkholderia terricola]
MGGSEAGASPTTTRADAQADATTRADAQAGAQAGIEAESGKAVGTPAGSVTPGTGALDFPVVGIGASAGGVQALLRFFENAPADMGMAFVVVLHLSPDHASSADEVFQHATGMPVNQVRERVQVQKNHVYVISPSHDLSLDDGHLTPIEADRPRGRPIAIDLFFRSLADAHRERAIAIVLSGTGADGATGIGRVKEQGGVTFAQDPADAEHPEMPQNALATGMIDIVLPVAEMPRKLRELAENARAIHLPPVDDEPETLALAQPDPASTAERALLGVLATLRARTGHDFRHYKRATILRRIERRLQVNGIPDLQAYQDYVLTHPDETPALLKDMLIGVTNFFRDRDTFEVVEREIVPRLFHKKSEDDPVRAWVAGCATGEEAYSLAMLLAEYPERHEEIPIQLFATDIDEHAIAFARAGLYPESITADVSAPRLRQFFTPERSRFRVSKAIRERVLFAVHNVLRDPPFSRVDLVSCRNLLIYLDRNVQTQVLQMFHFALQPGGYLLLGSSESAEAAGDLFTPVDKKHRIYRANMVTSAVRPPISMPVVQHGGAATTASAGAPQPLPQALPFSALHHRILELYAPPSVVVDTDANILHMSEHAGRFLRFVRGEPSYNLIMLVNPALRLQLRAALFQALRGNQEVTTPAIEFSPQASVRITVRAHRRTEDAPEFALVLFEEIPAVASAARRGETASPTVQDSLLVHLEEELHRTKQELRSTVEQSEASTEELKASNEELQAINEELRAATEELETSKEELQSLNEELFTVNAELQAKIEETGKAKDDLQNVIASTGIATLFVDRDMRIKRYTPAATELFNVIPSDLGRPLHDITHRLDYPQLADDTATVFESLQLIEREIRGTDGRYFLTRLSPYRTTDDHIDGAVLTIVDITALRRAEQLVRVSEERLHLAAQSTNDFAIIVQDMEGRVVTWNKGAERIFGYSESEMTGQTLDRLYLPEEREANEPATERQRAQSDGRVEDERWYIHKNGTRLYCSGVITPVASDSFRGFAKIVRDLTQRKGTEALEQRKISLERSVRQKVEAASRLKDEFLAVLSHELKNPLNLIHVKADMLDRAPSTQGLPVVHDAADAIRRSVISLAKIIDDLLDLSRVRTGRLALDRSRVDIAAITASVTSAIEAEALAHQVSVSVKGVSEPFFIEADPVRFEQILWNLASNAVKFTPPGGRIALTLSREAGYACVEVRDTGRGIEPSFLPNVFDMFSQAEGAHRRHSGGLGIGLALVKQLTEMHGGHVQAESAGVGKGARFRVWLPADSTTMPNETRETPCDASLLKGMKILLVDDAAESLQAFQSLLELEGAQVWPQTNGAAALTTAAHQQFDLILSDIGMPGMDGYELIAALRKLPGTASVPALALTGFGRPQDAARAIRAGYDGHLGKPVSLHALLDKIARITTNRTGMA